MALSTGKENGQVIQPKKAFRQLAGLILPDARRKEKPKLGNELEVFVVHQDTGHPITFETYQSILSQLTEQLRGYGYNFELGFEKPPHSGKQILTHLKGTGDHKGWTVCGEPGCQIEWAPGPLTSVQEVAQHTDNFLNALAEVTQEQGCAVVIPGLYPLCRGKNIPFSKRPRYQALRKLIESFDNERGFDLATGTCGLQINIDTTPNNWATTVQTALGIQPFLTALFANSPVFDKEATLDQKSNRAVLWFEEFGERVCALRELAGQEFFFPRDYITYALDQKVPMFAGPEGDISLEGLTLRDILDPRTRPDYLPAVVTTQDVANIFGTFYGQVKVKPHGVIELRGADASFELRHALAAFAAGLFYDEESLKAAHAIVMSFNHAERDSLAKDAPRGGLQVPFRDGIIRDIAFKLCELAHEGLVRRNLGEAKYLQPLLAIARGDEPTPAEKTLAKMNVGTSLKDILLASAVPVTPREGHVPTTGKSAARPVVNPLTALPTHGINIPLSL